MAESIAGAESPSPGSRTARRSGSRLTRQRFGLPNDFVPRPQRNERTILLRDNIYRLPNGKEFIPSQPTGALGGLQHSYALLTIEQYQSGGRGSVYVRTDGRIFDYSQVDSERDFFDTGYTMRDLQRTGKYAPEPAGNQKRSALEKWKRAAHAG
jgi:ribosomal protein L24E